MEDVSRRIVNEMAACIKANVEAAEPGTAPAAGTNGPGAAAGTSVQPGSAGAAGSGASAATTPAPMATAKPVNALGLLFSVLWARVRGIFSSKSPS